MGTSYIPARAQSLRAWAHNFGALLDASPGTYGVMAADAATVHGYVAAYEAALTLATDPATKTRATVAAKDSARAAMIDILRGYAQQIRGNRGVSNANKAALGLTPLGGSHAPLPAPVTAPALTVVAAQPLEQTLRYADVATPTLRAKPSGVAGLQLFVAVATVAPSGPGDARFRAYVTRQPFAVSFDAADKGKTAYYFARWQTRTGLTGPWSAVAAMVIA